MTTALYRRYRPESFGEMIGQGQVTEPLMTALRGDRVGHAYLFSGPRGCGKTTSARILARCLNCAEGPTDVPCGKCDSCIELGRGGGGSLDVVEIDAASHNGVDDARDLRERAVFAPARDRFKIFILDEAHMVTPQGFNALLKLVEEPPDHVKFIFATTEPEKVIGTIRSRTHHYPFRLVPPAAMLEYVEKLCAEEGVEVEQGVLPLVVRAGGGSPRDTLSLLDQLIAGSDDAKVTYARAVALLGYTPDELLDEVIDAFGSSDAGAAFAAVDRVVQTGQDPRRFVDDLLERLRDLIVVAATGQGAAAVLRGISADDLARKQRQADAFGTARLSRIADLVIATLDDMTGATSPRLQLELMVARVLARGADASSPSSLSASAAAPAVSVPVVERAKRDETPASTVGSVPAPAPAPAPAPEPAPPAPRELTTDTLVAAWPDVLARLEGISRSSWMVATGSRPIAVTAKGDDQVVTLEFTSAGDLTKFKPKPQGQGAFLDVRGAIEQVFGIQVKFLPRLADGGTSGSSGGSGASADRGPAPAMASSATPPAASPTAAPPAAQRAQAAPQSPVAPQATAAAAPRTSAPGSQAPSSPAPSAPAPTSPAPTSPAPRGAASAPAAKTAPAAAAPVTDWAVAAIPSDDDAPPPDPGPAAMPSMGQFAVDDEPEDAARARVATLAPPQEAPHDGDVLARADLAPSVERDEEPDDDTGLDESGAPVDAPVPPTVAPPLTPVVRPRNDGVQRYGEAVVRQVLGATFVREEPFEPPTRFS
ncbi:DNA polymerase III subunit gamma and tau [Microbacterium kyungheense]|uniref:DNA polymerase III subunit gamma/tau n=1 Tax=Microbacterium kyungheense TaxID=1263636 RepID=A0A543F0P3_9MICO|nr:DNA polymerase III subunit gamma and tau [Microbacterium kyungheense]TQM27398.1 DNA polymerase-3 subunit gamma/tau [Microbacterium kyungheense]